MQRVGVFELHSCTKRTISTGIQIEHIFISFLFILQPSEQALNIKIAGGTRKVQPGRYSSDVGWIDREKFGTGRQRRQTDDW